LGPRDLVRMEIMQAQFIKQGLLHDLVGEKKGFNANAFRKPAKASREMLSMKTV
jgi:hypothetical protein